MMMIASRLGSPIEMYNIDQIEAIIDVDRHEIAEISSKSPQIDVLKSV